MPTNLDWNLKFLACRMKDWTARNRLTCRKFSHRPPMPMRFYPERTVSVTHSQDINQLSSHFLGKLFASSSFYSPTIHPTVEDQVDLARRISHSLSDISNQTSKGQTMYSNRKKRSVKWIHDDGHEEERFIEGIFNLKAVRWVIPSITNISILEHQETKENGYESSTHQQQHQTQPSQLNGSNEPRKVPLKLVMDPRHVQDLNSMNKQFGYEPSAMSPEFGYELVNALNSPTGKGKKHFIQ